MTNRGMPITPREQAALATGPLRLPIARGHDWTIAEYVCNAGPGDKSFDERHEAFTIAAVVEGTFRYRADTGTSLLHPGALLLGNHGTCFACGHDHSRGDRCIALHLSPEQFSEIAATAGGTNRFTFNSSMLPATMISSTLFVQMQLMARGADPLWLEELVTSIVEAVISTSAGNALTQQKISALDERRISVALHLLELQFDEVISLDQLAAAASMSKYHFIRAFRRIVGTSPYQYLLDFRLRQAALSLIKSSSTISNIALDCGFGDLSTFVRRFRNRFGESPSRYRTRYGGLASQQ